MGSDSPARAVAQTRGIPIVALCPLPESTAGLFTLSCDTSPPTGPHRFAQPDDVALVLYTSGTTSQPKRVPLTHRNICTSAYAMHMALELSPSDRCLNVLAALSYLWSGRHTADLPDGWGMCGVYAWLCRPHNFLPGWQSFTRHGMPEPLPCFRRS